MESAKSFENKSKLNSTRLLKISNYISSYDMSKKLILLRHGESLTNLDLSQYVHFRDVKVPLSDKGKKQSEQCGSYWGSYCRENKLDSVLLLYSPYLRAKDTADIMAYEMQDVVPIVRREEVKYIHEQLWPECMDMSATKVGSYLSDCLKVRHQKGIYNYKFPRGGESGFEVSKRADLFIEELRMKYLSYSSDLIITVTHSYFMRVLLKELFGWSVEAFHQIRKPSNCKGYMLTFFNSELTLDPNQLSFKRIKEMD